MVYPNFNTNFSISCVSFSETIINICSKCLQWNCSLAVELCTGTINLHVFCMKMVYDEKQI